MSIMDYFNRASSAFTGSTGSYGGLLGDEERKSADSQARMAMAAALLEAGGPSTQRVNFGQALGRGMGAAQQARQGSVDQSLQAMMLKKQLASMNQQQEPELKAIIDPATGKPKLVRSSAAEGMEPYSAIQRAEDPAEIQLYNLYSKQELDAGRTPQSHEKWYASRAKAGVGAPFQIADYMGGRAIVDRTGGDVRQISTAGQEAAGAATIAGATQSAKTAAESNTQAAIDLPRVVNNAEQALKTIDDFEKHPGFNSVFGAESVLPTVPGTDQAGALAYYKQIQGKTFLEAFNSLKGAGQITETEGTKAEAAIGRLERAQKDTDAKKALDDLKAVIESGVNNARKKAGLPPRLISAPEGKRSREDILKQYNLNGR